VRRLLDEKGAGPVVVAGVVLAAALVAVVWLDWRATRQELLALLRDQAASLRQTVAAAARSNRQAAAQVETQITGRLLDNARLLAELDRKRLLDGALLDEIVRRHGLFRVTLYRADGSVELAAGGSGHGGPGPGGRGRGAGRGGPGALIQRLIAGGEEEATTDVHRSRWGEPRVAAGVRRARGGAIVLNVDATAAAALERQLSLDALLGDIVAGAPEVAYVVFEQGSVRLAHGDVPSDEDGHEPPTADVEREREVGGRPVLELDGPVALGEDVAANLRLGMRLDEVQAAEHRMLWQLGLSLGVSLALAAAGVGGLWLRRKYALLSERHARAEAALRRRDRLAAMGELAAGVAHEVRNPLNAIAMSVKRLRTEFREGPAGDAERAELDELLDVLDGQSRRIDATVEQFLTYARPRPLAPRPVDLDGLVAEVAEPMRALAASRGLTLEVDASVSGEVTLDPDQIRQALDNLLRNAVEATPAGGRVALAARREGDGVVLEVSDTGAGIAPEHLPRIFDLYFTTKAEGTGVGLAVTHQIVTAHGGSVDVESSRGQGTRFTLRLPARPVEGGA
jgi:signal transduction histidine kinase